MEIHSHDHYLLVLLTYFVGGVGAQVRQVLENLKNIVEAAGSDLSRVVKCTVLLADMAFFPEVAIVVIATRFSFVHHNMVIYL